MYLARNVTTKYRIYKSEHKSKENVQTETQKEENNGKYSRNVRHIWKTNKISNTVNRKKERMRQKQCLER